MEQKTYSCVVRLKGDLNHTIPLELVTLDELKLLAFIHGPAAVPLSEVRSKGVAKIIMETAEDGTVAYVMSQMQEYIRLARKYDDIVNSGRGRKKVEDCFKTRLDDFDAIIAELDPLAAMENVAAQADAAAALEAAGMSRIEALKKVESQPTLPQRVGVGDRFASMQSTAAPPG